MTNRDHHHSPSVARNDGGDAKLRTEGSGLDLDALEAVARAATPGPWFCAEAVRPGKIDGYNGSFTEFVGYEILGWDDAVVHAAAAGFQAEPDAEFAATFDPPTCLAMIQTQRELVAALSGLVEEFGGSIAQYHKLGPDWTHKDGTEVFEASVLLDREPLIEAARAALSRTSPPPSARPGEGGSTETLEDRQTLEKGDQ